MTLPELLKKTVEMQGSDLHLAIGTPPQIRVHGKLQRLEGTDLAPSETKASETETDTASGDTETPKT